LYNGFELGLYKKSMIRIEHLGIAVTNLDKAESVYEELLGVPPYKREVVSSEFVTTSFFKVGDHKVELLEATDKESAIAKFIERKGEGIHHVAFEVEDILVEMQRLREAGFILLNDQPKRGADNKLICFIHPKTAHGVLVELCQEIH
jgi:methylmalonyl-CoA/ethylmalonyl-CoA epimerase